MSFYKSITTLSLVTLLFCCNTKKNAIADISAEKEIKTVNPVQLSKADLLLSKAVKSHGGDLYNTANYSFVFRGKTYQFKNDNTNYEYLKSYKKEDLLVKDFLKNGNLTRTVNKDTINLTEPQMKGASGAINSVIYFATLPHKLQDKAVNKTYVGETTIKGENYNILGITFSEDGGGDDFDDKFHYWINSKTNKIDYLAYSYSVNDGGVRFRSAYNRSVVDGITFQDYINYKAEVGTPLIALPELYEADKLKELSKIKTETIINLNNK